MDMVRHKLMLNQDLSPERERAAVIIMEKNFKRSKKS